MRAAYNASGAAAAQRSVPRKRRTTPLRPTLEEMLTVIERVLAVERELAVSIPAAAWTRIYELRTRYAHAAEDELEELLAQTRAALADTNLTARALRERAFAAVRADRAFSDRACLALLDVQPEYAAYVMPLIPEMLS
jgi:hypothetical protein